MLLACYSIDNWLSMSAFLKVMLNPQISGSWENLFSVGHLMDLAVDLTYALVKFWHLIGPHHLVVSSTDSFAETLEH